MGSQPQDNFADTHRERDAENEEMKSYENTSFLSCAYRADGVDGPQEMEKN